MKPFLFWWQRVSKKSTVLVVLAAVVAFGLTLVEGRKLPHSVRLAYRPEVGASTDYKMEMKASSKLVGMEEDIYSHLPQESTTFGRFVFSDKILSVTSQGNIQEEITYSDVELGMEVEGRRQNLPFADKLKGKTILMEIDRDGRVVSTKGLDQLSEELKGLNIQEMFIQLRPIFPDRELKVGDSWDNRTESLIPIGGMLISTEVNENYTLSRLKEAGNELCAVIGVTLGISTKGKTVSKEKGVDIDIDMEGEGKGELIYAFEKSRLISSRMGLDLTSKIRSSAYRERDEIQMEHRIDMFLEEEKKESRKSKKKGSESIKSRKDEGARLE